MTAIQISDSAILVVDVVEGVTLYCETLIRLAVEAKMQILVVLNKVDRLVLELKLPPEDAYLKIK